MDSERGETNEGQHELKENYEWWRVWKIQGL